MTGVSVVATVNGHDTILLDAKLLDAKQHGWTMDVVFSYSYSVLVFSLSTLSICDAVEGNEASAVA
jgi:hypothetical protein